MEGKCNSQLCSSWAVIYECGIQWVARCPEAAEKQFVEGITFKTYRLNEAVPVYSADSCTRQHSIHYFRHHRQVDGHNVSLSHVQALQEVRKTAHLVWNRRIIKTYEKRCLWLGSGPMQPQRELRFSNEKRQRTHLEVLCTSRPGCPQSCLPRI